MNKLIIALLAVMVVLGGCRTMRVYNVEGAEFVAPKGVTLGQLTQAIKRAGLRYLDRFLSWFVRQGLLLRSCCPQIWRNLRNLGRSTDTTPKGLVCAQ